MGQSCSGCGDRKYQKFQNTTIGTKPQYTRRSVTSKRVYLDIDSVTIRSFSGETDFEFEYESSIEIESKQDLEPTASDHDAYPKESKDKTILAFKEAMLNGNDSLVMYYVEEYPDFDLFNVRFENGDNCLQVAVRGSLYNLIYYLLNNGYSPDAQNPQNGETALHTAVRSKDTKIVALLCQYKADPKIINTEFETPITIAIEEGDKDIIDLVTQESQQFITENLVLSTNSVQDAPTPRNDIQDPLPVLSRSSSPCSSTRYHRWAEDILDDESIEGQYTLPPPHPYKSLESSGSCTSFEQNLNLDKMDSEKLREIRIAKKNPFGRMNRENTVNILDNISKVTKCKEDLPKMEAWLEKKSSAIGRGYQKRWLVLRGNYLLWNDSHRISIIEPEDINERRKWKNSVNIMSIKNIEPVTEGKTQRKFKMIVVKGKDNKTKEYLWKCLSQKDRNYWVDGIKKHISYAKFLSSYIGTK